MDLSFIGQFYDICKRLFGAWVLFFYFSTIMTTYEDPDFCHIIIEDKGRMG